MSTRPRVFGAGAFAYALRPHAARKLTAMAETHRIEQAVDWFIFDAIARGDLIAYKTFPGIIGSPEGDGRDSDNDEGYNMVRLLMENMGRLAY